MRTNNKNIVPLALLSAILLFSNSLSSQILPLRKYTVADGLPENRVMTIIQDSKGFIWLRSKNGVSRFDGTEMITYRKKNGLPGYETLDIFEDNDENIWALSYDGLSKYDGEKFNHFSLPENMNSLTLSPSSACDIRGNIFLYARDTTESNQIFKFTDGIYTPLNIKNQLLKKGEIKSICICKESNDIIILINDHIYVYSLEEDNLHKADEIKFISLFFNKKKIYAFSQDSVFYQYGNNGFTQLPSTNKNPHLHNQVLTKKMPGTDKILIYDYPISKTINWPFGHLNGIFQDDYGTLWIYSEDGLYRLLSEAFEIFDKNSGISENIWSIVEDSSGSIWMASLTGNLQKYDGKSLAAYKDLLPPETKNFTLGSRALSDGRIWFTTFKGILEWDGKTFSYTGINEGQAEYIYEDTINGTILVGSTEGLIIVKDDKTDRIKEFVPNNLGYIRTIAKDKSGFYWILTDKGAYKYNGISIEPAEALNSLDYRFLTCLVDPSGKIWFGGDDGLFLYDQQKQTIKPVLPPDENHAVKAISFIDSSRLIVGRVGDIIILETTNDRNNDDYNYLVYNESNGFQSTGCLQNGIFKDSKGKFWILGNDNVIRFNPDMNISYTKAPVLYITGFDIMNSSMEWVNKININYYKKPVQKIINLEHDENYIRVHLSGISTHYPEAVRYSFRIPEKDSVWTGFSSERSIVLPALSPGRYNLQVRASSFEGILSKEPAAMIIYIKPAFWQTLIFRIVIIIIGILAASAAGVYVTRYLQRKKERQSKIIREYYSLQMGKFAQQFDPHFAFNILSSVTHLISTGKKEVANEYLIRFSRLLRKMVSDNSFSRTIEEELKFIEEYFEMQKLKLGDRFNYEIIIHSPEMLKIKLPRLMIHNFAENAIKWGIGPNPSGGKVIIRLEEKENYNITIMDTGIGLNSPNKTAGSSTGKGLEITKELIRLLNNNNKGEMTLDMNDLSEINEGHTGTEVVLRVPKNFNLN